MRAQKAAQNEALRIACADSLAGPNMRGLMQSLISFDDASFSGMTDDTGSGFALVASPLHNNGSDDAKALEKLRDRQVRP